MPDDVDRSTRLIFQLLLEGCMFGENSEMTTFHVIVEYMIAAMAGKPGLSMARILAQLSEEYEVDVTNMMVAVQRTKRQKGLDLGKTLLEDTRMSKDWAKTIVAG